MIAKAFLDSVLRAMEHLGWSSARGIAEYTQWDVTDVVEALNELKTQNKVKTRIKGRGSQYGLVESKTTTTHFLPVTPTIPEKEEITIPSDITNGFSTLDEFMQVGLRKLPKDIDFSAKKLAETLLKKFPDIPWSCDDIIGNIGKMVRLKRLGLKPILEDSCMKYHYIVTS